MEDKMTNSRYNNDTIIDNKYTTHTFLQNNYDIQYWSIQSYKGLRIDVLADKYYKNPSLWHIIAKYNKIKGDSLILNGDQGIIKIPKKVYQAEVR